MGPPSVIAFPILLSPKQNQNQNLAQKLPVIDLLSYSPSNAVYHSSVLNRTIHPTLQAPFQKAYLQFIQTFLSQFPTRQSLEAEPAKLGISRIKFGANCEKHAWYSHMRVLTKYFLAAPGPNGEKPVLRQAPEGSWYKHTLPLLLELTGWYSSDAEIQSFVQTVRTNAKDEGDKARRFSLTTSLDSIFSAFSAEAVSVEHMIAYAENWTSHAMEDLASKFNDEIRQKQDKASGTKSKSHRLKDHAGHYFNSARVAYSKETGLPDHYLGMDGQLAWLVSASRLPLADWSEDQKTEFFLQTFEQIIQARDNAIQKLLDAVALAQSKAAHAHSSETASKRDKKKYVLSVLFKHLSPAKLYLHPEALTSEYVSSIKLGHTPLINFIFSAYETRDWAILRPRLLADLRVFAIGESSKNTNGHLPVDTLSNWEDFSLLWNWAEAKHRHTFTLCELFDYLSDNYVEMKVKMHAYFNEYPQAISKAWAREKTLLITQEEIKAEKEFLYNIIR